ncbi:MAG: GIY-YIG nuclease family protein, partial [Flavisolibacter sp.]
MFLSFLMTKCGVYIIVSPSDRIYVGQSNDIDRRWREYKRQQCKSQVRLKASFEKNGVDAHKFLIAELCDESQLNDLERFYQDVFDATNKNGLNCRLTSTNDRSGKLSDEVKGKISASKKGTSVWCTGLTM